MTFGIETTTDEVLADSDLSGKRILVTGTSAGLGVETARALAARGAQVIGTVRNLTKGLAATAAVRRDAANGGGLEQQQLDLASLASVRSCADRLLADGRPFDLVVTNAGIMAPPFSKTVDGFETQFGTNHLGHFVLVNRLAPLLRSGSRVVILSSGAHRFSDVDLEDPNFDRTPYVEFVAYGRSKTANALFAVEFDRRHKDRGIRATAVHPGVIETELNRYLTPAAVEWMKENIFARLPKDTPPPTRKTIAQGAATTVWAGAVAPAEEVGGRYCEDCHVAEVVTGDELYGVRPHAIDPARAAALWTLSEDMVGERF
jgi:NAD(P)-dependent dehydrogenase (short-subunit alcohol dehydrogenase family)